MRRLLIGISFLILAVGRAEAQFVPDGCPGRWIQAGFGMACQCPDGSLASGWPMSCGHSMAPPQTQGQFCSSGVICPHATSCCGMQCCNPGYQCSSAGCIPEGASDCGNGQYCHSGTVCWRAPMSVAGLRRGQFTCATNDRIADLEKEVSEERERQKEADRKKRQEEEKAQADAKVKAIAPARQKVSDLLTKEEEKRRADEFKKSAEKRNLELQRSLATNHKKSAECQLYEIGFGPGSAEAKACAARDQQAWLAQQTTTTQQPTPTPLTGQQYEYLRQNAAGLQPEQRTLPNLPTANQPPASGIWTACSTFPNSSMPPGGCPPSLTPEQAAAAAQRQRQIAEEAKKVEAERIAREQEATARARAEAKRKEEEERAKIYQVRDVDDSDCRGVAIRDLERNTWCGVRGHPGLRRCEIITITKMCEKQVLRDHCVETSRVRQDVCR